MKTIEKCRVCGSTELTDVLGLGEQYVSDFRTDDSKPNAYPITVVVCEGCLLVQLRHTTPAGEMYHDNYGFKSGVSNSIKDDLKDVVFNAQAYKPNPKSWLDIASNDGTLLSFVPSHTYRVGVDPVGFLCKEALQHADVIRNEFFTADVFAKDTNFDVITSISCFYDMDDPNKFVSDVAKVLADDGVWAIQQNYLLPTMQLNAIDNFCHEHLEYYTLLSLENLLNKYDLEVFDISTSTVNGGSIRTMVAKKGVFPIEGSVAQQREIEKSARLHEVSTYLEFGKTAMGKVRQLRDLVLDLNSQGKKIAILAASTRGATIWQAAGFTSDEIVYAIERNPAKVGKYFSAIGVPIVSEEFAREDKPDYELLGPWFFAQEIVSREKEYLDSGGHIIVPLPEVKML